MSHFRWVYVMSVDERNRLVCRIWQTRLLKFSTFQDPLIRSFARLFNSSFSEGAEPVDLALLPFLVQKESTRGGVAILDGADGAAVARRIVDSKRAYWADGDGRRIHWQDPIKVAHEWQLNADDCWAPRLKPVEDKQYWQIMRGRPPLAFCRAENRLTSVVGDWPDGLMDGFISTDPLPLSEVARFCVRLQNRFPSCRVPFPDVLESIDGESAETVPIIKIIRVESVPRSKRMLALNSLLCARVHFRYGERELLWNDRAETVAFHRDGQPCVLARDRDLEKGWIDQLHELGLEPRYNEKQLDLFDFHAADFFLQSEKSGVRWETLLREKLPALSASGWEVVQQADIQVAEPAQNIWYDKIETRSRDWYTYEAGVEFEGVKVPVVPLLQRWLATRPNHTVEQLVNEIERETFAVPIAKDGTAVLVPGDRIGKVLRTLLDRLLLKEPIGGDLRISAWRAAELAEDGVAAAQALDSVKALRRFVRAVRDQKELQPIKPHRGFKATLRPYQQLGLGWLDFLASNGLSGILADDMGLGKTVQVIAMLHKQHNGAGLGPVLVVTPTSVLRQWQTELQKFAKKLKVVRHHGPDRATEKAQLLNGDIVLTTYGVLRQDLELLEGVAWDWVILDEAHVIKNPLARTSRAATRLVANRRLCMTGTPVENRLSDLWSLFRFVLPGLLGDLAGFHKEFAAAAHDARGGGESPAQQMLRELLRQRIAPFVLRRRKEEVLTDLPEKIEIDRLIPVSQLQAEVYESYRLRLHRELAEAIEARGVGKAQLTILEGLLRLRQICCDLRLLQGEREKATTADSAKLKALLEIVEESLSENRPMLVFSQFVGMLQLIEAELSSRKISYSLLTGKTGKREEQIRRFQEGEVDVFLISLKAGGLGLNLTRAETVVHYDPWWNPAAESQATDRAHRIGQKNTVTMYRLVSEKTVEERILTLHAAKRELAESLVSSTGNAPTHRIDAEVLEQLLGGNSQPKSGHFNQR